MYNNSSIALQKLRVLVTEYQQQGIAILPNREELSELIGVGQRSVRRAQSVLEMEGRIEVRQGSGAHICSLISANQLPAFKSIQEVMEVRLFFEPYLCDLAAKNIQSANIAHMTLAQSELLNAKDADHAELWDGTFHREIALATQSPLLVSLYDQINFIRQSDEWRDMRESIRNPDFIQANHQEHAQILKALILRNGPEAMQAMKDHIGRLLNGLLEQQDGLNDNRAIA